VKRRCQEAFLSTVSVQFKFFFIASGRRPRSITALGRKNQVMWRTSRTADGA